MHLTQQRLGAIDLLCHRWDRKHSVIKTLLHVHFRTNKSRQENKFVYLAQTSEGGDEGILSVGGMDYSVLGHCRHRLRQGATEERRHCDPAPTPPVCTDGSAWPAKGQREKTRVTIRKHCPQVTITVHTSVVAHWESNKNTTQLMVNSNIPLYSGKWSQVYVEEPVVDINM